MWMEPMANKANGKHHLINVRISIEKNDEHTSTLTLPTLPLKSYHNSTDQKKTF